ncbi:MAG: methyltransferase domain-containing protein [bacterium]
MSESRENSQLTGILIEKLGWRGEGLAKPERDWLVIPGALPGEYVDVEVHAGHPRSRKRQCTLTSVTAASPDRIAVDCPQFPACRGCHVRHVSRNWERDFKRRSLVEIVAKFSGWEVAPGDVEFISAKDLALSDGYRMRGRLARDGDKFGLVSPAGLQPMNDCLALTREARDVVAWIVAQQPREDVEFLAPSGETPVTSLSPGTTHMHVHGHRFMVGLDVWTHASEICSSALYAFVERHLRALPRGRLLELGCGIGGVTHVAAACGHDAIGIDADLRTIALAQHNVPNAHFRCAAFERGLRELAVERASFDYSVINPMREPIGERAVGLLESLGVRHVLYLAPSPASGVKDLAALKARGWTLDFAHCADLHPRTYHFMMVAGLSR